MDKRKNTNNKTIENDTETLISLFNAMFEQVRLQQEVRDRWFEHYLSIIGAVSALAALCFGYYSDKVEEFVLMILLASIFALSGILGLLFYLLYLMQRQNYKKQYKELAVLQEKIYKNIFSQEERKKMIVHFKRIKKGADFVTLLIENMICSVCIALSVFFSMLSVEISICYAVLISLSVFLFMIIIMVILYNYMEVKS